MAQLTFFLIDDDEDDRELFQIALNDLTTPTKFVSCESGAKALEMLKNQEVFPDYIFIDLNMPQMTGKECLVKLKEMPQLLHIPVVIFSTSNDPRDIKETKALGAFDFITKPPKTSELAIILENFISVVSKKINNL